MAVPKTGNSLTITGAIDEPSRLDPDALEMFRSTIWLVKRSLIVLLVLALTAVGVAVTYQEASTDRDYRNLLARGDAALRDDQTYGAIEAYSGAIALRPDSMLASPRRHS